MSHKVLFIKMLLLHFTTQSQTEIQQQAKCKENVTLECLGLGNMNFISVAWYKIGGEKPLGIVRINKGGEKPEVYNFTRPAMFGENHSLFLSSVMPNDSGIYECEISAGLGDKNKYPRVHLIVEECATQTELTTSTNALNSTLLPSHEHEKELPVTWIVTGFMVMGLAKIILSVISISQNVSEQPLLGGIISSIWVIRAVGFRSSRQQRRQW